MSITSKQPIFVPREYQTEIEKLSKMALMDVVWDYAMRSTGQEENTAVIMDDLRATIAIVKRYRKAYAKSTVDKWNEKKRSVQNESDR